MSNIVPVEVITERIFEIRSQKVMTDADLAALYDVPTKALNQAVKRNPARFPEDFMFQLTVSERNELVTKCDRLTKLKHSSVMLPDPTNLNRFVSKRMTNMQRIMTKIITTLCLYIKVLLAHQKKQDPGGNTCQLTLDG